VGGPEPARAGYRDLGGHCFVRPGLQVAARGCLSAAVGGLSRAIFRVIQPAGPPSALLEPRET
jgi:hypothetical protein